MATVNDTETQLGKDDNRETKQERLEHESDSKTNDNDDAKHQTIQLRVSQSLHRKIKQKAADEGVPVQELLGELIAEGLVLRAWEIMERKIAMRTSPSHSYKGNNRYEQRSGRKNFGKGNRSEKNAHILEDRAAFVEYVRNQEKGGRK